MDASLMCKRILADDGLVRLRPEGNEARKSLAGAIQFFAVNLRLKRESILPCLDRHHNFFQRRISGTFADAVDGALHLARTGLNGRKRIRYRKAQIIVTVDADGCAVAENGCHAAD